MPVKQQGAFAIVWGIPGTDYKVNGLGVGFRTVAQNLARSADKDVTQDEQGETVNIATFNQQERLTLSVYPTATTLALAIADAELLPFPGDKVALLSVGSTTDGKTHAAAPDGRAYRCDSAEQARSNTAKVMFNITLERVAGITDYTAKT
jgi:hypothetical protein